MSGYERELERIRQASSLEDIRSVVRDFSARASGNGGVLYSGPVGNVRSEALALEIAERTGQPIINHTARAQFLADPEVDSAIRRYLDSISGEIQIAFLPPYAPDLNPVEYLWA
jgi:hypothetical protein